jgi:hypothetical protein
VRREFSFHNKLPARPRLIWGIEGEISGPQEVI